MRAVLALFLMCLGSPSVAGPWARAQGDFFLSFGTSFEDSRAELIATGELTPEAFHSIYAEYGLGRRLTAIADLGRGETGGLSSAYLRYTLTAPAATWQVAGDLGLARRTLDGRPDQTFLRVGASLGRGLPGGGGRWYFPLAFDGGWTTLEVAGLFDTGGSGDMIWQAEATVGLNLPYDLRGVLSVKGEEFPDDAFLLTTQPSVLVDLGRNFTGQLGVRVGLVGTDLVGVNIGLWRDF